jgi:hypothetical protein
MPSNKGMKQTKPAQAMELRSLSPVFGELEARARARITANMAHDPATDAVTRLHREQRVAWATTIIGCLYIGWMGLHLWRSTGTFAAMFAGLGSELPVPTRILIDYRSWIYPGCFGSLVGILVAKELIVRDKRLSTMLTFLVTIAAQFLAQWMTTVYYLPLFDLINKLS